MHAHVTKCWPYKSNGWGRANVELQHNGCNKIPTVYWSKVIKNKTWTLPVHNWQWFCTACIKPCTEACQCTQTIKLIPHVKLSLLKLGYISGYSVKPHRTPIAPWLTQFCKSTSRINSYTQMTCGMEQKFDKFSRLIESTWIATFSTHPA